MGIVISLWLFGGREPKAVANAANFLGITLDEYLKKYLEFDSLMMTVYTAKELRKTQKDPTQDNVTSDKLAPFLQMK